MLGEANRPKTEYLPIYMITMTGGKIISDMKHFVCSPETTNSVGTLLHPFLFPQTQESTQSMRLI